jgi:hypothetical protein
MDAFSFFFGLFGLLLGLAIADIANGVATSIGDRKRVALTHRTMLLATFVVLDITGIWDAAWFARQSVFMAPPYTLGALAITIPYYLAAILVFPRERDATTSLEQHYWENKRIVVASLCVANGLLLVYMTTLIGWSPPDFFTSVLLFWVPLLTLFVSRKGWVDSLMLTLLIGQNLLSVVMYVVERGFVGMK